MTGLGKRLYNDELRLVGEDGDGRRRYQIYGFEPSFEDEPGTDLAAVARGRISITPGALRPDRPRRASTRLREWDLDRIFREVLAGVTQRLVDCAPRRERDGIRQSARRSSAARSRTTTIATTSSTTRRSGTTPTTRCSTSCAGSRRSTRSCGRPTRRPSAWRAGCARSTSSARSATPSRCSRWPTRGAPTSSAAGRTGCTIACASSTSSRATCGSCRSRRSTGWRSR